MPVFNVGSINIDYFYYMDELPLAGQTLAANSVSEGLGGKGANQSVAARLAGSSVAHIGAVGASSSWPVERLASYGIDISAISTVSDNTGHAVIYVDDTGENSIVLYKGANHDLTETQISDALANASSGDILLLQNETNLTEFAAKLGRKNNMQVIYSAAPFSADAVERILPFASLVLMNEGEAADLEKALGPEVFKTSEPDFLITKGAGGSDLLRGHDVFHMPANKTEAVDTTGAGDCYAGYLAVGLDQGMDIKKAMRWASLAASIKIQRSGTSDAFPSQAEVNDLAKSLDA